MNLSIWTHPFGENDTQSIIKLQEIISNHDIYGLTRYIDDNKQEKEKFELFIKKFIPNEYNGFYYAASGSEAVEHALVIAAQTTKKNKFFIFEGSYHGSSIGLLPISYPNEYTWELPFKYTTIKPPYCYRCNRKCDSTYPCLKQVFETIDNSSDYAGILIDPSFGNIVCGSQKDYFKLLKELCKEKNILLIFDEIRTGIGRTGRMFAFQELEVKADIFCISKAIACGIPLALTIYQKENRTYREIIGTSIGLETSFAGTTLALEMAMYTMERLSGELSNITETIYYMYFRLQDLKEFSVIGDIRNYGMIFVLEFVRKKTGDYNYSAALLFVHMMRKLGIYISEPGYQSIVLLRPYYNIQKQEIDDMINASIQVLKTISKPDKEVRNV